MNRISMMAAGVISALAVADFAVAGDRPVADVWVSVAVTPTVFRPFQTGVIELTMHNNGPDVAGGNYPGSLGNLVVQRAFLFTAPSQHPPYRIMPGATGCNILGELVGPNVNWIWGYLWSFYFPPIPAGESRTCRIPIQFFDEPFESFDTNWRISTNPEDPDLTNNTVAYRFIAGSPTVTPVPALGWLAKAIAMLSLLMLSARALRNRIAL